MSRDFIGSSLGRSFRQSTNRDRITRGSPPPETEKYSFAGYGTVVVQDFAPLPPFLQPEYVGTLRVTDTLIYNQSFDGHSMPTDTLSEKMAENYSIGEFVQLRFKVAGIFEAYPISTEGVILEGSTVFQGSIIRYQYIDRPMVFSIRIAKGSFPAQPDAWTDVSTGGPSTDLWTNEFIGNDLVVNIGLHGTGSIKTIIATLRIGVAGPFQSSDFTMFAHPLRVLRFEPFTDTETWAGSTPYHRRSVGTANPANPLVAGANCIPFGPLSGSGGFPAGYFGSGTTFRIQDDCQWCWGKLVGIERVAGHTTPSYSG